MRIHACKIRPYHPSHDASAHTLSLHIRDELCMLLLHIEDQHDAHQTHQLHLWKMSRFTNVKWEKIHNNSQSNVTCTFAGYFYLMGSRWSHMKQAQKCFRTAFAACISTVTVFQPQLL